MSVQTRSTWSRHSVRVPAKPASRQPAGRARRAGQTEYWSSSFTTTTDGSEDSSLMLASTAEASTVRGAE